MRGEMYSVFAVNVPDSRCNSAAMTPSSDPSGVTHDADPRAISTNVHFPYSHLVRKRIGAEKVTQSEIHDALASPLGCILAHS